METIAFADGLGRRVRSMDDAGTAIETLRLCRELAETGQTAELVGARVHRLAGFSHPVFATVRCVERAGPPCPGVVLVSEDAGGTRLSEVIRLAQLRWLEPDLDAALWILRQVSLAMAALHAYGRDVAHGALGPERILVRSDGSVAIVEHVLAPAIEALSWGRLPLWTQFRIPVQAVAGTPRFDQLTDVVQMGVLALALFSGRLLHRDDYPQRLQALFAELAASNTLTTHAQPPLPLRQWMARALQIETRTAYRNAVEASAGLEAVIAGSDGCRPSQTALVRHLAACRIGEEVGAVVSVPPASVPSAASGRGRETTRRVAASPPVVQAATGSRSLRRQQEMFRADHVSSVSPPARRRRPARPAPRAVPARRLAVLALVETIAGLDWRVVPQLARMTAVVAGLSVLFGVTYLGARGYLTLPTVGPRTGTLVIETRPPGAELIVDGHVSGRTPAVLELTAGDHTVAVLTPTGTTMLPVNVVAGTRKVENIEIRPRRPARRGGVVGRSAASAPRQAGANR